MEKRGNYLSRQERTTHHYLNQLFIHMIKVLLWTQGRAKFFEETRKIVLPLKFARHKFSISTEKKIQELYFCHRQRQYLLFIKDFKFTKWYQFQRFMQRSHSVCCKLTKPEHRSWLKRRKSLIFSLCLDDFGFSLETNFSFSPCHRQASSNDELFCIHNFHSDFKLIIECLSKPQQSSDERVYVDVGEKFQSMNFIEN